MRKNRKSIAAGNKKSKAAEQHLRFRCIHCSKRRKIEHMRLVRVNRWSKIRKYECIDCNEENRGAYTSPYNTPERLKLRK